MTRFMDTDRIKAPSSDNLFSDVISMNFEHFKIKPDFIFKYGYLYSSSKYDPISVSMSGFGLILSFLYVLTGSCAMCMSLSLFFHCF